MPIHPTAVLSLATLLLVAAPQAPNAPSAPAALQSPEVAQEEPLSRVMPPPGWIARKAEFLRLSPETRQRMMARWDEERDSYELEARRARDIRLRFVAGLQQDDFDPEVSMGTFEELLLAENEMKRIQARVRLDAMSELSVEERRRARTAMQRRKGPRRDGAPFALKRAIEDVRALGRRLRLRGEDTSAYRDRMRAVEELIRSRDLELAKELSDELLFDMREALDQ